MPAFSFGIADREKFICSLSIGIVEQFRMVSPWLGTELVLAFCTWGDAENNNAEEAGVEKHERPPTDEVQIVHSFYSQGYPETRDDATDHCKHLRPKVSS